MEEATSEHRKILQRTLSLPVAPKADVPVEHEGEEANRLDVSAEAAKSILLEVAQDASNRLLQLMLETRQHTRYWEEALQVTATRQARLLLFETGLTSFLHQAYIIARQLMGSGEHELPRPGTAIRHRFRELRGLKDDLAVVLGEVHLQADEVSKCSASAVAFGVVGAAVLRMRATVAQLTSNHRPRNISDEEAAKPTFLMVSPSHKLLRSQTAPASVPAVERSLDVDEVWEEIAGLRKDITQLGVQMPQLLERYRSPTLAEQTWVSRYAWRCVASGLGLYLAWRARDLPRWLAALKASLCAFAHERVVEPVQQIAAELQHTFTANKDVDLDALEESRHILRRMLDEFDQRQHGSQGASAMNRTSKDDAGTMERVLLKFETEAKSPIRNLVTGELSNLMVIQMQSIKVQTESALLQMDRIMQANQINFAIMTAMPAVGMLWVVGTLARAQAARYFQPRLPISPPNLRCLLVEVERAIWKSCDVEGRGALEMGLQIFSLNELYVAVSQMRARISALEWHNLQTDISDLANPDLTLERKLQILRRMLQTYSLFISTGT